MNRWLFKLGTSYIGYLGTALGVGHLYSTQEHRRVLTVGLKLPQPLLYDMSIFRNFPIVRNQWRNIMVAPV